MNKQELLERIDEMICKQEEQLVWLESKRQGKFMSFFFPSLNESLDAASESGTKILNSLKASRIEYQNYNFES